jgi:phosphate transport system substrate-binding protein
VKQTPGAIGYVELAYADQNKLPLAALRNREGVFATPPSRPPRRRPRACPCPATSGSPSPTPGKTTWPIASFTYLLVRRNQVDGPKGAALLKFLWWAVHQGQAYAAPLDYAPLPAPVVAQVEQALESLTVQGRPIDLVSSH